MALALTPIPRWILTDNGVPVPGAKLYTWLSGTSTPQAVYADYNMVTPRSNPVVADADGVFPIMYLAAVAYRMEVRDANDVVIYPAQDQIYDWAQVQLGASGGSALIGFIQQGAGAVATTVQADLRRTFLLSQFGAYGLGIDDESAEVQAAIDAALLYNRKLIADGETYLIGTNLNVSQSYFDFEGYGMGNTTFKATSGCTRILVYDDAALKLRCRLAEMSFNCNSTATSAIYAKKMSYHFFENLHCYGAIAGADTGMVHIGGSGAGEGATSSQWIGVSCSDSNATNAVYMGGNNNGHVFLGCTWNLNTGIGVSLGTGYGNAFYGCVMEDCDVTGWYVRGGTQHLTIDSCYIADNESTGYAFTSPSAVTVKASIIINASATSTTWADIASNQGIRITNNHVALSTGPTAFIFAPAATSVHIANNTLIEGSSTTGTPVFATAYNSANSRPLVTLENNRNLGLFTFIDASGVGNFTPFGVRNTTARLDTVDGGGSLVLTYLPTNNFAVKDLNTWSQVVAGNALTWTRSASTMNGIPCAVWNANSAIAGTSEVRGFSLNAANYTILQNKWVAFSCWTKTDATDKGIQVYVGTGTHSTGNNATTEWTLRSGVFLFPATGTMFFGIQKFGAATGDMQVAMPVLSLLGSDWQVLLGDFNTPPVEFTGTAAPTAGVWVRGDRVWKSDVSAGATPGYVCVASGTPGTWGSMAVLF